MACREVADSSSGSGFLMNDSEARELSNSPARSSYEDKPSSRNAFDIESTNSMQRKRENNGGQEIPGATVNKMTRMGLPSPKKVPGYLAVGGPAFPRTSRENVEKNNDELNSLWEIYNATKKKTTDIWGDLENYERFRIKGGREQFIISLMRHSCVDSASANMRQGAARAPQSAPAAGASLWKTPESARSVEEFRQYLTSSTNSHSSSGSQRGNLGGQQNETDEALRYPWGFSCRDNMYRRAPSRPCGGAALFDPWAPLNRDATVRPSGLYRAQGQAQSNLWAPLNQEIDVSVEPSAPRLLGADGSQRGVAGHRPLATGEPGIAPNRAAPKKPLVLLTPDDFLTLSNTDISSMLEGVKSNGTDTGSVKSEDDSSDKTDGPSDDSKGNLTDSDRGTHRDEDYVHPMQVISDSIDKVDSWLQKHSDVLGSGVSAAADFLHVAPLFEMPADGEVVERCQDIKRREFESTLDLARRKLRANTIKFERVAARFEKLYNEHLLEKCWLAELEAMKGKMSMEPPALPKLNKTKRDEAPAPADINAPGPSGLGHK